MSYIKKPRVIHPQSPRNELGLTERDYQGGMSTLCAGCGHDSVTSAIVQAAFELSIPPHRFVKMSGIGCSSKTPAYFMNQSHGFNSVHGRMPSVATGANAANAELNFIGVSGDGVDQDDMIAFLAVHESAQNGSFGNAAPAMRADSLVPQGSRLRYVNCPVTPYLNSDAQNVCANK